MAENDGLSSDEDVEEIEVSLDEDDEEESQEEEEKEEAESDESDEEEAEPEKEQEPEKGGRAQKRIRNLIKQRTALQKEKEQLATQLQEFKEKLEKRTSTAGQTEDFAFKQFEERVAAQEAALEAEWEDAYEEGDKKKLFQVQNKMSAVALDRARLDEWKRRKEATPTESDEEEPTQTQPQVNPRLVKWLAKNKWFRQDEEMTYDALQVDQDLREQGVEVGSDEYFTEVDKRMREMYPKKFKSKEPPKTSSAGHARSSTSGKKKIKVTLSASELATAKRLGVTPESYARQKAKLEAEE